VRNADPQLPLLAVDKSFAHAVKAQRLAALAEEYTCLVPTAFYYEVFTTNPEKRPRTLTGLGEFRRMHLPTFLREEVESGTPARTGDLRRLSFNPEVLSPDWGPAPRELEIIDRYRMENVDPLLEFWEQVIWN
jgi:hypothetical protein